MDIECFIIDLNGSNFKDKGHGLLLCFDTEEQARYFHQAIVAAKLAGRIKPKLVTNNGEETCR